MFRLFLALVFVVATCSGSPRISSRIVGGADADIADYPYTASIEQQNRFICGATIVSADWVLTLAGCSFVWNVTEYAVRVGSSIARVSSDDVVDTGTLHNVTEWIQHPLADIFNREYDFALVKVDPPFEFNANVAAAALPALDQESPEGAVGVVTGWGQTETGSFGPVSQLQSANLLVADEANCTSSYNESTFCARGVDGTEALCWHDEGGPLVVDDTLFGLVLWSQWCANPQDLQVFSKVAVVRDWIDTTINA